jgi:hypothetical protein
MQKARVRGDPDSNRVDHWFGRPLYEARSRAFTAVVSFCFALNREREQTFGFFLVVASDF